jgi:GT2 family glycosyltransferase
VDDASEGGRISATAKEFAGVRALWLPSRRGFCGAVNVGVAAACGEIVQLLNDDTEVTRGWADAALACFSDAAVGAVAPLVLVGPAAERIDSAGDRYFIGGIAAKRGKDKPAAFSSQFSRQVFGASGSSAFYRRTALLRIGGFPEEFTAYFDDVDVAFRLQRAGWQAVFEPASRVLHRVSASYGKPRGRLLEQQSLNEERVFWRNLPGPDLLRALPLHVAVLAAKAWRRWREGSLVPFLRGRLSVLGEISQILHHRRMLARLGPALPVECWGVERHSWFDANSG